MTTSSGTTQRQTSIQLQNTTTTTQTQATDVKTYTKQEMQ